MKIVGLDPGQTTGLAVVDYDINREELELTYWTQFDCTDWSRQPELARWLAGLLRENDTHVVVIEQFVGGGPRGTYANETLRLVGWFTAIAQLSNSRVLHKVPQARTAFLAKARRFIEFPHKNRHATDALAHIFSYVHRELGGPGR